MHCFQRSISNVFIFETQNQQSAQFIKLIVNDIALKQKHLLHYNRLYFTEHFIRRYVPANKRIETNWIEMIESQISEN